MDSAGNRHDRLERMFVEGDLATRLLAVFLILTRAVLIGIFFGTLGVCLILVSFLIAQAVS